MEELILRLKSEDWWVSENAAYALGETCSRAAVGSLVTAALGDELVSVRRNARHSLVKLGTLSIPALVECLNIPRTANRTLAIHTLGEIAGAPESDIPVNLLKADDVRLVQHSIIGSNADVCKSAFRVLYDALANGDVLTRKLAAFYLGQTGDSLALEPLVAALRDKDWRVRTVSVWALGDLKDPRAIGPLKRILHGWYLPFAMSDDRRGLIISVDAVLAKLGAKPRSKWWW